MIQFELPYKNALGETAQIKVTMIGMAAILQPKGGVATLTMMGRGEFGEVNISVVKGKKADEQNRFRAGFDTFEYGNLADGVFASLTFALKEVGTVAREDSDTFAKVWEKALS